MPMSIELDSADLRRLHKALDRLGEKAMLQNVLKAMAIHVQGKVAPYAPELPRPEMGPWYERGWGMTYSGKRGKQTSEKMSIRWYRDVFPTYTEIGNTARYAGYVHGAEQTEVHKQHGWKQLLETAVEEMPYLIAEAKKQIRAIWEAR